MLSNTRHEICAQCPLSCNQQRLHALPRKEYDDSTDGRISRASLITPWPLRVCLECDDPVHTSLLDSIDLFKDIIKLFARRSLYVAV